MPINKPLPLVAILLASYNGEKFIKEQLDSFNAQTYPNWILIVSDDGSSDKTLNIVRASIDPSKLLIFKGPLKGYALNFLSLVHRDIKADLFAFSDQDDIWNADKLNQIVLCYEGHNPEIPFLYCSNSSLITETGEFIKDFNIVKKPLSFENALVQNVCTGNALAFNSKVAGLIKRIPVDLNVVSHDWLVYLVTAATGGSLVYDPTPRLKYRQHTSNLVGSHPSKLKKILEVFKDNLFKESVTNNLKGLNFLYDQMPSHIANTLLLFNQARTSASAITRLFKLYRARVYCHTNIRQIAVILAILLKKI